MGEAFECMQDSRAHDCSDSALGCPHDSVRKRYNPPTSWATLDRSLLVYSLGADHLCPSSPRICIIWGVFQRFVGIWPLLFLGCVPLDIFLFASWTGKKLGSAVRKNLLMWGILTGLTILLVLFLVIIGKDVQIGTLINVFVSISNTFTLFCVIFLLGNVI